MTPLLPGPPYSSYTTGYTIAQWDEPCRQVLLKAHGTRTQHRLI